ncbi:MAG: PEP-utilizing enzyme [Verrucomicrobiota bacterium]
MKNSGKHWFRLNYTAAAHLDMGPKAEMLCRGAIRGLSVPRGLVLRHEGWREVAQTITGARDSRWLANARAALFSLGLPPVGDTLAIRSAFSAEDGDQHSMAGHFASVLSVDAHNTEAIVEALRKVWLSAEGVIARGTPVQRRDVILMEMVLPKVSGVAFTEYDFEDDLVNYVEGTAAKLMDGQVSGQILQLPKIRLGEWADHRHRLSTWQTRLALLLKGVRRVYGDRNWDVEWADDGRRCYLVQIRPITAPPMRDELFTTANLKEILPEIPSPLMSSIIESNAFSIFSFYHQFDRRLPKNRPFFRLFAGRPYMNLSLLADMMRRWGLPTGLVSRSLGGEEGLEAPHRPLRILRNLPAFLGLLWMQLHAIRLARRELGDLNRACARETPGFGTLFLASSDAYRHLVHAMFGLISAATGPVTVLAKLGVLSGHQARHENVTTRMHRELHRLRELAAEHPEWKEDLRNGRVPEAEEFRQPWNHFLEHYGHRGVHETDIAKPRWRDAPETLLTSLAQKPVPPPKPPPMTIAERLTWPLWWWTRRLMAEREVVRHEAMRGFGELRRKWCEAASHISLQEESLWLMREDEIHQLDAGWLPDNRFSLNRDYQLQRFASIRLADLIHAADPNAAVLEDAQALKNGAAKAPLAGRILVNGRADGQAWVLHEPAFELPDGFDPERTILVARSVDAGWMATFGLVAGVVVEIGGELSHGSILLRELGMPSLTNVSHATDRLHTGTAVQLRASEGVILPKGPGAEAAAAN